MKTKQSHERKLQEKLLLARRVEGDRLMLDDQVMVAALDGSRAMTPEQAEALRQSPLTLRRFRQLSIDRQAAWQGSHGMLRAAASGPLETIGTDDGYWKLHFVGQDGAWQVILVLEATAPFAARMLRDRTMLRVVDGGGAIILQGTLDADGEYEGSWPFETPPGPHFHAFGASFAVEPVR